MEGGGGEGSGMRRTPIKKTVDLVVLFRVTKNVRTKIEKICVPNYFQGLKFVDWYRFRSFLPKNDRNYVLFN